MPWYSPNTPRTSHFELEVNWQVSDDWVTLSDEDRNLTGIIKYQLARNTAFIRLYDYTLTIESEFENYDYQFTDGEPDTYGLNAKFLGNHAVQYKSESPSIRKVSGAISPPTQHYG
ncbi:hypothetical protein IQ07DRAFT_601779 [Pyrenochaeta sp. DS3sAY3a]|nr:hypothetical protein IQ07DRAFT_601779 [Pyrenochaeta sp. DS3sAY3a]